MPIVSGNVRLSAASTCSLGTDKEKLPAPILHRLMAPAEGALPGVPYSQAQCWGGDVGKCALFWPDTVLAPHEAVHDEKCAWLSPLAKSQVAFTRFSQQCYEVGYWYAKYSMGASWAIGHAEVRPASPMTAMLPDFAAAFLLGARSASQTASCRGPLAQDGATFAAVVARDVAALPAEEQLRLRAQAAYLANMLHRYMPGAEPSCQKFMAVLRAGVRVGWRLPASEGFPAPHEIDAAASHLVKGMVSTKMYSFLTHAVLSEALRTFHRNFLEAAGLAGAVPAIALDTAWPHARDAGAARVGHCTATADRSQLESYLLVQQFIVRYGHRHGPFLGQPQLLDRWNGYVDHVACAAATTGCYGEKPYGASKAEAGSNLARLLAKAATGAAAAPPPLPWFAARPYLYAPAAPARLAALGKEAAAAELADDFARCYRSASLSGGGSGGAVAIVGAIARAGRHWGKGEPADVILTPPASAGGAASVSLLRHGDKEQLLSAPVSGAPYRSDNGAAAFKLAAQAAPCDAFKAANTNLGGKVSDGCGAAPLQAGALCLCIAVLGKGGKGLDVLRVRVEAATESHFHLERGVAALFAGGGDGGGTAVMPATAPLPAPQAAQMQAAQQQAQSAQAAPQLPLAQQAPAQAQQSSQAVLQPAQPLAVEPQSQLPAAQQAALLPAAAQQASLPAAQQASLPSAQQQAVQEPAQQAQQGQQAQQQAQAAPQQAQAAPKQLQQPPLAAPQPHRSGGHLLRSNAVDHG